MANANITAPTTTQNGDFNVTVTFENPITDFGAGKVSITAVTGNGITGVTFEVMGEGTTYNLPFQLPEDVQGSLRITISGQVTREGSTTPEGVMANSPVVTYNNITNVTATFGDVSYRDNGVIAVPIAFAEAVIAPSKSICKISHVSGDALSDIDYRLIGKGTDYALITTVPPNRAGSFEVAIAGDVLKVASRIWDNVIATPKTVAYNTTVPELIDYDIPENYVVGEKFDVVLVFNVPVTFIDPQERFGKNSPATFLDHFIFEGAALGTPNLYRKTDNTRPTLPIAATLAAADWTQADLTTVPASIYLLRWTEVESGASGSFNVTLKPNSVRGPVA